MQRYADTDRDSGVYGFEISDQAIKVWFKNTGNPYIYSYQKAGSHHVENMKRLAIAGDGLNEYINEHVRKSYD
jgi:hypothetical protein